MDSLGDTLWDVVICGTGLQQSLLALSLSRSSKSILHIDPNNYYGGADAAFSLQEAESWASSIAAGTDNDRGTFKSASTTKPDGNTGLSFPRAYSLALSPQLIHARSKLLSQLVSSRAYRQVEFLAVGSFFIFKPSTSSGQKPSLVRIPSTREDVFSTTAIPTKAKRGLMKFLKFVLNYDSEQRLATWQPYADGPLTDFLQWEFKMDAELQTYILTLTLSLDGLITTRDGLSTIYRHLTSMGVFGPGFAAVYPKWGGISEIAQVACRAGAVGGAVYMLATGIQEIETSGDNIELRLTSGDKVKTRLLVRNDENAEVGNGVSRLAAVVGSPLKPLFEALVEGAPLPAVAVISFPAGSLLTTAGKAYGYPVYVFAHSSDTGECPVGQSVLYLTTLTTPDSKEILTQSLQLLSEVIDADHLPPSLFQLYHEHGRGSVASRPDGSTFNFPDASLSLLFDDSTLEPVHEAWKQVMGETAVDTDYMTFPDREGIMDVEDMYD
ncbi:GDP dissociation inhibitor [Lasiosphaeria hispida]|uniref:Rab proteins geranylgeranyltransferase n=1 Tax=Lasiosphaeria hispida TaxID=260671 RepID=A0AAJ0MK23_9PEZI|nr:GDP dissociation inhibitor [Lasiosphaeria hispida]